MAEVIRFFDDGRDAPIMEILYDDFTRGTLLAPEGIQVGDKIRIGSATAYGLGSVLKLSRIAKGFPIYNS